MKLHYRGKYNLNPESLPHGIHKPGAIPFKEASDTKTLGLVANIVAGIALIPLLAALYLRYGKSILSIQSSFACIFAFAVIFPHEFLHAICFKKDVYLFTNLSQGMFFVVGPETMSKGRFIFMCLLPNIVFGFIPYIISMVYPPLAFLGVFGAFSISMGAGDYYNVFNAITQMPKGARTYLYQFNSFWYMPEN